MKRLLSKLTIAAALAFTINASAAPVVTLDTGTNTPHSNQQPSLGLNYIISLFGEFGTIGEVGLFAGNFAPAGTAFAHGQLLPIASNTALFSRLGTIYGGDGETTFALPDLRGRSAIHMGAAPGVGETDWAQGMKGGTQNNTLTTNQIPSHFHDLAIDGFTQNTGGPSQPVNNVQPSLALDFKIATTGLFPSENLLTPGDSQNFSGSETFLTHIRMFAGFPDSDYPQSHPSTNGQILPINNHQAVFSLMGTTFGGDGQSSFGLPDLRGRIPVGMGNGPGISNQTWGEKSGSDQNTLSLTQMAAHLHEMPVQAPDDNTELTGGNTSINNMQPSLGLNYMIATTGVFPSQNILQGVDSDNIQGAFTPYIGEVALMGNNFATPGWMMAQGQLLPISQYSALFSLLGTTYGGDGESTFGLPDLRGRAVVGAGNGPGLANVQLGQRWGNENTSLAIANLPSHNHVVPEPTTIAILLLGFAGLTRRRKQAA